MSKFHDESKGTKLIMAALYEIAGGSRQLLHKQLKQQQVVTSLNEELMDKVMKWRERHPGMGSRSLHYSMSNGGIHLGVGVNKFERIVRDQGYQLKKASRRKPKTSDGKGRGKYKNLTNGLILNDFGQLIVADISYYSIEDRDYYLFLLKDVYSQRILGLVPSETMEATNALLCLNHMMKVRTKKKMRNGIHHTDNGSQYEAIAYRDKLKSLKMRISRAYSCEQNGSVEQMNHIVKNMYLDGWAISTKKELDQACKELIYLNNEERAIKQLGYRTPNQFEQWVSQIEVNLRPQKELYDFATWT